MKKRILLILAAMLGIAAIMWGTVKYYHYVESAIYDESVAHLSEIFSGASQRLGILVNDNWNQMELWEPYLLLRTRTLTLILPPRRRSSILPISAFYPATAITARRTAERVIWICGRKWRS